MFTHQSNEKYKKTFCSTDAAVQSSRTIDMHFDEAFETGFMKDYIDSLLWFTFKEHKRGLIITLAAYDSNPREETIKFLESNPVLRFIDWSNQ